MRIHREDHLTLFRSCLYETVSLVLETKDTVLVVDPCWLPFEVEEIRRFVEGIRGERKLLLLFTHSDYDHIIGYGAFPDAVTVASPFFRDKGETEREAILEQIKAFDDEYYVRRDYDIVYPHVDVAPEKDGDTYEDGDLRLTFYHAVGHNDDGLFVFVEPLGVLIAGDYFSDIEFPYIYCSSSEYEKSLRKLDTILASHPVRGLLTGHGNAAWSAGEMKRRQKESLDYIARMRDAVRRRDQDSIDTLIEGCPFPRNMRKFHRNNQLLFERELGAGLPG